MNGKMNSGISEERGEYIPHSLLAISNKETGEYWNQSSEDVETLCCCNLGGIPKRTICMKCTCSSTVKHWRIPKEYSKLGSPKDLECKNNILVAWEPEVKASHLFEINEHDLPAHMESSAQVLVASVPLLGVQHLLCRKQQDHTLEKIPVNKENEKMVEKYRCKVEQFLKEQEGFLFVIRFLFGLLMLLGPGFIVPIIFTLRQMRHFHRHCHNEECPSEMLSNLTTTKGKYQFPLFHIPMFICRLCRDQRNTEKIFDLHSQLKTEHEKFQQMK